ncbi:equilibrative nucleoside transporter 2 isoform X2 [Clarias gariepinus]|uniref:equilibrative nucleoside transporter 2 isoform X2 n=1 Tax=Clarias gariepinus TaxID=13013 RepID=UPI00234E1553|nr:equilibrative nucleoside transporter 2 isoform X2 [Clarias gariepinus]
MCTFTLVLCFCRQLLARDRATMRTKEDVPSDRWHSVGIIFFILGLGTLLPWNFFMTASMYFNNRLNTSEWSNGTLTATKEYYFNNWMTLLSQLPLLLFTLLNSILYPRISEKVRIAGSLVFILILFILTTILVKVPMKQDTFFSVTMATIWFINSFGAVLQGSLFGLVGLLPQKYSSVFMSGQGLAGTFAALAMLFAIASETNEETAALGYFITPCVGTLVTLISYLLLPKLEFARFYLKKSTGQSNEPHASSELLPKEAVQENGDLNSQATDSVPNGTPSSLETDGAKQAFVALGAVHDEQAKSSVLEVLKKISVMAFCVTFVFTVTLSVFPAVTVDVKTIYPGKWESYFIPVCCFLLFNVMDWTGRTVTSFVQWVGGSQRRRDSRSADDVLPGIRTFSRSLAFFFAAYNHLVKLISIERGDPGPETHTFPSEGTLGGVKKHGRVTFTFSRRAGGSRKLNIYSFLM